MTTGKRASLATEAENKTSENTIFYYTLRVLYCLVQELHLSSPRYSHISRIKIFILFFNRILDLLIFEELRSEWIQFFFLYTAIWPLMLTTYSAGTQLLNDKKKNQIIFWTPRSYEILRWFRKKRLGTPGLRYALWRVPARYFFCSTTGL